MSPFCRCDKCSCEREDLKWGPSQPNITPDRSDNVMLPVYDKKHMKNIFRKIILTLIFNSAMNGSHQCDMPYSAVNRRQLLRQGSEPVSLYGWFHPMRMNHRATSLQEQNNLNSRDTANYLHGAEAFLRSCQLCSYSRTTRRYSVMFTAAL
jgi:hypothetical protein